MLGISYAWGTVLGNGPIGDDHLWYHLIPETFFFLRPLPGPLSRPSQLALGLPAGSRALPAGPAALTAGF